MNGCLERQTQKAFTRLLSLIHKEYIHSESLKVQTHWPGEADGPKPSAVRSAKANLKPPSSSDRGGGSKASASGCLSRVRHQLIKY